VYLYLVSHGYTDKNLSSSASSFGECAQSAQGNAETVATVEATPQGYGRWDLFMYLLPFLAAGILWTVAGGPQNSQTNFAQRLIFNS
jgi:hypothetical protein